MTPLAPNETRLHVIVQAIRSMMRPRGAVTLRANQTTTTVTNEMIGATSVPTLTAGPGTWSDLSLRVSAVAAGSFTITHSSEAAARTVHWQL